MSFSNIQSVTKTADASAVLGRCRLVGVYFTNTGTGSSFTLKDGATSSGAAKLTITTPAAAGSSDLMIPDMGLLFEEGIFIDVADAQVTSVTLLFEGGAAVPPPP
jgi:hypothetical protein